MRLSLRCEPGPSCGLSQPRGLTLNADSGAGPAPEVSDRKRSRFLAGEVPTLGEGKQRRAGGKPSVGRRQAVSEPRLDWWT